MLHTPTINTHVGLFVNWEYNSRWSQGTRFTFQYINPNFCVHHALMVILSY